MPNAAFIAGMAASQLVAQGNNNARNFVNADGFVRSRTPQQILDLLVAGFDGEQAFPGIPAPVRPPPVTNQPTTINGNVNFPGSTIAVPYGGHPQARNIINGLALRSPDEVGDILTNFNMTFRFRLNGNFTFTAAPATILGNRNANRTTDVGGLGSVVIGGRTVNPRLIVHYNRAFPTAVPPSPEYLFWEVPQISNITLNNNGWGINGWSYVANRLR